MTRPAGIPQWAWDEALLAYGHTLKCDPEPEWIPDIERIARALLAAYERGRGEQEKRDNLLWYDGLYLALVSARDTRNESDPTHAVLQGLLEYHSDRSAALQEPQNNAEAP